MAENPLVSIVVPTKNSEGTIAKCLQSIKMQTYTNVEIIVVDNYSKDHTVDIADKFGARVYRGGPERASQVNFGVTKARGKYVYRVDSDFILETSVVEEAVTKCEEGYDAIAVHNTSDSTVSFWSKVRKLERDCYRADELNIGARFLKREVFESVGGFDETLVAAEDYDLHNKLLERRFRVGRIRAQENHIGEPRTLGEIVRKHFYYGKTMKRFIDANRKRGIKQINPLRLAFLRNWKLFAKHPRLMVGFTIYQAVRYIAAGFGLLFSLNEKYNPSRN